MAAFNCLKIKKNTKTYTHTKRNRKQVTDESSFPSSSCPLRRISRRGQFPGRFAACCEQCLPSLQPPQPRAAVLSPRCCVPAGRGGSGTSGTPGHGPCSSAGRGDAGSVWPVSLNSERCAAGPGGREGCSSHPASWREQRGHGRDGMGQLRGEGTQRAAHLLV